MDYLQAEKLLKKIQGLKVAVLGDIMLDRYLFGNVVRISPEAPVPIVTITRETSVLGGAANVAANLRAINATPILIGVTQQDTAGNKINALLHELGINTNWLVTDPSRPTTVKTRIVGQKQQMLRIDKESTKCCDQIRINKLCSHLKQALEGVSAIIISDYAKGVVNACVMEQVRELCKTNGIPWIVDPKPSQVDLYHGATLMTPNTKELSSLSTMPSENDSELIAASQNLIDKLDLKGLLVTRSEKGMTLVCADSSDRAPEFISANAKEVFDVSGAGDTVIATFSAAISVGASWKNAALLANTAAGIVVSKMGTATATSTDILSLYRV